MYEFIYVERQHECVHVRESVRSVQACLMLEQLGFTNTKNLVGGILAWNP